MRVIGVLALSSVLFGATVGAPAMATSPNRPALGHIGGYVLPASLGHLRIPARDLVIAGDAQGPAGSVTPSALDAAGIDVRLPRSTYATISGRVTRAADGSGVGGATVCVVESTQEYFYQCYSNLTAKTSASGQYTIVGVFPGDWIMHAQTADSTGLQDGYFAPSAPGHISAFRADATTLTVGSSALVGKNMALRRGHAISGTVTRLAGGTPVKGERVTASVGDETLGSVTTDTAGRFRIRGLPASSYRLQFNDENESRNIQDGCYDATSTGFVSDCAAAADVVLGSTDIGDRNVGLPAGLTLSLNLQDGSGGDLCGDVQVGQTRAPYDYAYTWACGPATFQGLSQGDYRVSITGDGETNIVDGHYASTNADHWVADDVDGTDVEVNGPTDLGVVKPAKGHIIRGALSGPSGPVQGASVEVTEPDGTSAGPSNANTDGSGKWKLVGLPAGDYLVRYSGTERLAPAWYDEGGSGHITSKLANATTLTVGPDRSGITATLARGYSISGRITDPKGNALEGAYVLMLPVSADAEALGGFGFTRTSKTGAYSARGLPAGDYHVLVVDFERPDLAEGFYRASAPGHFTPKESAATAVHVGP